MGEATSTERGSTGQGCNVAVLRGRVANPPVVRELRSGGVLVGYEVRVPGGDADRPAAVVPVVWPSAPADAGGLAEGDDVVVVGCVRRRFFRAGGTTQSRTEVVADQIVPARQRARVGKLVAAAAARVSGG